MNLNHFLSLAIAPLAPFLCLLTPLPLLVLLLVPLKAADQKKDSFVKIVILLARLSALLGFAASGVELIEQRPINHEWFSYGPISLTIYFDTISAVMLALVSFLALSVIHFSNHYLDGNPKKDLFFKWLSITSGSVLLLVISGNLALFALAWMAVSLSLHQLLTFHQERYGAVLAGRKKFFFSRLGDLALITAILLVWRSAHTLNFSMLFQLARTEAITSLPLIGFLLVGAAVIKSAQFPFHSWLPDTMETPTPVSALMHAGIINAGGFLIIRLSPLLIMTPGALESLAVIGGFSALFGSIVMITQSNIKRGLAFSTIAQMGFMMLQCGLGAFSLALLHIVSHSLYKAFAFLSSGKIVAENCKKGAPCSKHSIGVSGALLAFLTPATIILSIAFFLGISPWHHAAELTFILIFMIAAAQLLLNFWSINASAGSNGNSALARIFHTDRDEEVAKPDETRQAKILTQGCVSTHCSSQNQSLTQYSSGFPASAVDRCEISGLPSSFLYQSLQKFVTNRFSLVLLSILMTLGLCLLFFSLHAGAEAAIRHDLPTSPMSHPFLKMEWSIGMVTTFAFLIIGLRPFFPATFFQTVLGKALFVHAYNGFYISTAANRFLSSRFFDPQKKHLSRNLNLVESTGIKFEKNQEVTCSLKKPFLEKAIASAIKKIPPLWPLSRFVAVNPFLGFSSTPFSEAAVFLKKTRGISLTMPLSFYEERYQAGIITKEDLYKAIKESTGEKARVEKTFADLFNKRDEQEACHFELLSSTLIDRLHGTRWSSFITEEISKWCVSFFDQGQALWESPWKKRPLFSAWKEAAALDHNPFVAGIRGWKNLVESLPKNPISVIERGVIELGIAEENTTDIFYALLASVAGWAGYLQFLVHEAGLAGKKEDLLTELLAIRIAYELALRDSNPGFFQQKNSSLNKIPATCSKEFSAQLLWQRAHEYAIQRHLFHDLAHRPADLGVRKPQQNQDEISGLEEEPPLFQALFCIDVRSEVYRRSLEQVLPRVETIGFAGFFGFPIEVVKEGESLGRPQSPVLIKPNVQVVEYEGDQFDFVFLKKKITQAWSNFKSSAVSSFVFVELTGLGFFLKIIHSFLHRVTSRDQADSTQIRVNIPTEKQIDMAAGALRHMGLANGRIARVVLFCGHFSKTENNPYASSLDCGACGGHSGEINARTAATVLNNSFVRKKLLEKGIVIPKETVFLAGAHNTTTDEITLFDQHLIPTSHQHDVSALIKGLTAASSLARKERATLLGLNPLDPRLKESIFERSNDWSQVRPEWGLAGNYAFIAAPRRVTKKISLAGKVFLHDYDHSLDHDESTLELILSAPVVVGSWINLQYYASTVDNRHFGSGDKTIHHVSGVIGVIEGNSGDIRTGLPFQSLHDGKNWRHEPLRLHVCVQASKEAIDRVLMKHPSVATLVKNQWIHLFAMSNDALIFEKSNGMGGWIKECF